MSGPTRHIRDAPTLVPGVLDPTAVGLAARAKMKVSKHFDAYKPHSIEFETQCMSAGIALFDGGRTGQASRICHPCDRLSGRLVTGP